MQQLVSKSIDHMKKYHRPLQSAVSRGDIENINRVNFDPKAGLVTNLVLDSSPPGVKTNKLLQNMIDRRTDEHRSQTEPMGIP